MVYTLTLTLKLKYGLHTLIFTVENTMCFYDMGTLIILILT